MLITMMFIVFAFLFTSVLAVSVMAMTYVNKCNEKSEKAIYLTQERGVLTRASLSFRFCLTIVAAIYERRLARW